jgi:hypothetical protein
MSTRAQLEQLFASLQAQNITAVRLHASHVPCRLQSSFAAKYVPAERLKSMGSGAGHLVWSIGTFGHRSLQLRRCSSAGGA